MFDEPVTPPPVAVVGVGALLPGEPGAGGFWRTVMAGRDQLTDVPASRWLIEDHYDPDPLAPDKTYVRRGAFLSEVEFDPMAYGIAPNSLSATDSAQLLALVVADQVLNDTYGDRLPGIDRERIGVVLGSSALPLYSEMSARLSRPRWAAALREQGLPEPEVQRICERILEKTIGLTEDTFPGGLSNVVAGRVANRFDLHGLNHTTDAACAGSFAALSTAIAELALGRADMMLAGGVDTTNNIDMFVSFSKTPALSPTEDCRPFSADADGTMLGEGLAIFALKRLADAERDGDRVYAVIRGVGAASDGSGTAIYAPVPAGQARALRRAYREAGYDPRTVELVEAHGTGTKAGDAAEFAGLREVFGDSADHADSAAAPWCALGSVKSQIGHTKSAAGAAGLLKAVFALHHKVLPPTIKVSRPNPKLDIDGSPFYLNTQARPWVRGAEHPRRASVSSFGFGGSNFHVTVEEYVPNEAGWGERAWRCRAAPSELALFSAESPAALLAAISEEANDRPLADTARLSQARFQTTEPARLAVIATDPDDLAAKLATATAVIERNPESPLTAPGIRYGFNASPPGRIGFLFPGQGAQYVGMGADLAMHVPRAQRTWDRHGTKEYDGLALHRVVFPPPVFTEAERERQRALLTATEWTQPALVAHSLALLDVLGALGLRPDAAAGHSLGELPALHAAGVLDADAVVDLARRRGELIRDAAGETPGAMVAVSAARTVVEPLIADVAGVWLANDNGPRQVVLSGRAEAVAAAIERFGEEGIATRRLNTAAAFHSPVVEAASGPLVDSLAEIALAAPRIPVYGNADAAPYPADPDLVRKQVAAQLASPVLFNGVIERMYADGVRTFVEIGAGNTLTNLVARILGARPHLVVGLDRSGQHGVTGLHEGLGQLAVAGVDLDFAPLWEEYAPPREPDLKKGARMTVSIDGGNYGRPYPPPGGAAAVPPPNPAEPAPAPPATDQPVSANGGSANAMVRPEPPTISKPPASTLATAAPLVESAAPEPAALAPYSPPATVPSAPAANGDRPAVTDPGLLMLIEQTQRQTAQAHADYQRQTTDAYADYQRQVTESHLAYLRLSELSLGALLGSPVAMSDVERTPLAAPTPRHVSEPRPALPAPPPASAPAVIAPSAGLPAPAVTPAAAMMAPPPQLATGSAPAPSAVAETAVEDPPAPATSSPDSAESLGSTESLDPAELEQRVLAVVAERTGYPAEILNVDMELVADLGIDSIKRVEILSAFRDQIGDLPESDIAEFAVARTLREILDKIRERVAPGSVSPAASISEAPSTSPAANDETTSGDADPAASTLLRTVPRMVPAPATGLEMAGLHGGPIAVTDDGTGVAPLVAATLRTHGCEATVVDAVPADAASVILLNGLAAVDSPADASTAQRAAFRAAMTASARLATGGGVFVTVQDTGGDFGLAGGQGDRAWLGGLAGLARTAAKEWPKAAVKAIDCERGDRDAAAVAEAIVAELRFGGPELDVALRADGSRHTLRQVPAPLTASAMARIGPDSVIVATGGARGVTAASLLALAAQHRPKLVLLGRTPLEPEPAELAECPDEPALIRVLAGRAPSTAPADLTARARQVLAGREVRQTVAALESVGSPVRYVGLDIRDRAELDATLAEIRAEWGPITGIVHGAGVLADAMLVDKTVEQLDRVLGTKIDGLRNLLEATADDPLRVLCLFSSVAGAFGNPGQSDYAVANEVLAQVASTERARRPEVLVRSIAWGPWRGGMVTAALADLFTETGVDLIPIETGAAAFVAELAAESDARVCLAMASESGSMGLIDRAPGPVQIRIDAGQHPYLADHAVGGVPVLPLALAAEWFARIGASWLPESGPVTLRDLRVLRKITLPDLADGGHVLGAHSRLPDTREATVLEVELRTIGESAHIRAVVSAGEAGASERWSEPSGLLDGPAFYEGEGQFHGPRFHAVRSVTGIGAAGVVGELVGVRELGWGGDGWFSDPAALDGCLQLSTLWAMEVLGSPALPMAIGECRLRVPGVLTGSARCVVLGGQRGSDHAVCDAALIDEHGTVLVELLGVELVRRPD